MSEPENEFAALMARVRLDDNEALATLISLYEPGIRRAARVILSKALRSSLDPNDLVQSVHLQLILGVKQRKFVIDSPEHLRSLAVTLLRHRFIQLWRRHRCQARHNATLARSSHPMKRSQQVFASSIRHGRPNTRIYSTISTGTCGPRIAG